MWNWNDSTWGLFGLRYIAIGYLLQLKAKSMQSVRNLVETFAPSSSLSPLVITIICMDQCLWNGWLVVSQLGLLDY